MKITLLFIILVLSGQSFAQNCEELRDGEVVRVDEENKSLANFRVQDQDGIGVCYANTGSLLLQSALPNNPEISYLHLATLSKKEKLKYARSEAKKLESYDIYARKETDLEKAISGGGAALQWDLAIDGGNTCEVILAAKKIEQESKKPSLCARTEMNLENILSSGDKEHKQFKTFLESSIYMNEFQKIFGDINEKPSFFSKNRIEALLEKHRKFKTSFEEIVNNKVKKLEAESCNRINADNVDLLLSPLTQQALTYKACFKEDFTSKDEYWCKIARGLAFNAKENPDGAMVVEGINPEWKNRLKEKISKGKDNFSVESLSNDIAESFLQGIELTEEEKKVGLKFMREAILGKSKALERSLQGLSDEYNEIAKNGFSLACVKRNTYGYFQGKDFEEDWKNSPGLCTYGELMKQAANVIIKYKDSGLESLESVLDFVMTNAGLDYDQALMTLYASDCNDKTKISIPKDLTCTTLEVTQSKKKEIDSNIVKKLKSNQPLAASLCSRILKKPRAQFTPDECGHHALGVIGVKCVEGKYKYLLQNSWGADNRATKESGIENVEGKGAYWFSEQDFYDSVYGIDFITRGKP